MSAPARNHAYRDLGPERPIHPVTSLMRWHLGEALLRILHHKLSSKIMSLPDCSRLVLPSLWSLVNAGAVCAAGVVSRGTRSSCTDESGRIICLCCINGALKQVSEVWTSSEIKDSTTVVHLDQRFLV